VRPVDPVDGHHVPVEQLVDLGGEEAAMYVDAVLTAQVVAVVADVVPPAS
jgi:hypothetical protein